MQKVVGCIGNFLSWIMETTICESLNSAANIILSMVSIISIYKIKMLIKRHNTAICIGRSAISTFSNKK